MSSEVLRIELAREDVAYLESGTFLPQALRERLWQVKWSAGSRGQIDLPVEVAEQYREAFTERLARVGFDSNYSATDEGIRLEYLIDRFQGKP